MVKFNQNWENISVCDVYHPVSKACYLNIVSLLYFFFADVN